MNIKGSYRCRRKTMGGRKTNVQSECREGYVVCSGRTSMGAGMGCNCRASGVEWISGLVGWSWF